MILQITLLKYFRNYMSEHLLKAGANIARREGDELARLPYLSLWFRTKSAIILHLTNGTVQINFFQVSYAPNASPISPAFWWFYFSWKTICFPLTGPHKADPLSADGCGDIHRREARLPHLQAFAAGGVWLQ